jgi:hypothetical protein
VFQSGSESSTFSRLLGEHETLQPESRWLRGGKRALQLRPRFAPAGILSGLSAVGTGLPRFAEDVAQRIDELQQAVWVIGLGLDFGRWQRFVHLTPTVIELQPGELGRSEWHGETRPPRDECGFCYDFVIDSALRLQESALDELGRP